MVSVYLVPWASVWRRSARASRWRRAVEVACRLLFYAGVPALVPLRFFV